MTKDEFKKLLNVYVIDPFSADCWMKEKTIEGGISRESFTLNVYIGSTTHPREFEDIVSCRLLNNQEHNSRSAIIYLGDEDIESSKDSPLVEECLRLGIAILILRSKRSVSGEGESYAATFRENVVKVIRGLGYLGLRRDMVDLDRIYLWGQGRNGLSCLLSVFCDERAQGLVLEKTPTHLALDEFEKTDANDSAPKNEMHLGGLVSLVAPIRVGVFNSVRDGKEVTKNELDEMFTDPKELYSKKASGAALRIDSGNQSLMADFLRWLTQVSG